MAAENSDTKIFHLYRRKTLIKHFLQLQKLKILRSMKCQTENFVIRISAENSDTKIFHLYRRREKI